MFCVTEPLTMEGGSAAAQQPTLEPGLIDDERSPGTRKMSIINELNIVFGLRYRG